MSDIDVNSPVTVLPGVGPARAAAYAKTGVTTLGDLLYHIPRAYENRGDIRQLRDARRDGGKTALVLTVATEPRAARLPRRMTIHRHRRDNLFQSGISQVKIHPRLGMALLRRGGAQGARESV